MKKAKKRRRAFRHLNQFDRDRIEALLEAGHKQKEIAGILKVDAGTVSREIKKRGRKNGRYSALAAQRKANVKRLNSKYQGMKIERHSELRLAIIAGLKQHRSPDEIAGRKKKKQTMKREMIPDRISLKQRPKRGEHAEGDLFVSPIKTGVQRSGALICVPSVQLLAGRMIENKKRAAMARAVKEITADISIDDLTLDNGIENKLHQRFGLPAYFADPHSPWQKPHIENGIGLLRRWFIKKGTDLRMISEEQLQGYLYILNGKYRKSLGYRSAYEAALERGIIRKIPDGDRGKVIRKSCISL